MDCTDDTLTFVAARERAAHRTVIDHRLTWKQRDDVADTLSRLGADLADKRRVVHASAIEDMAPLIVTCRDVERVAAWLDSMGKSNNASDARAVLYASALRLRQIVEV